MDNQALVERLRRVAYKNGLSRDDEALLDEAADALAAAPACAACAEKDKRIARMQRALNVAQARIVTLEALCDDTGARAEQAEAQLAALRADRDEWLKRIIKYTEPGTFIHSRATAALQAQSGAGSTD